MDGREAESLQEAQEIELKLALINEADYSLIINDPHIFGSAQVEKTNADNYSNTYFDTSDGALYQSRLSYRIRKTAQGYTATIKGLGSQRGGLSVRSEWNVSIPGEKPAIEPFESIMDGHEFGQLARIIGDRELLPIFRSDFQRMTVDLRSENGSLVEFAADKGWIIAGKGRLPIGEVELELKDGSPADLLKLGAQLAARYPLRVEERSKFARGLQLLGYTINEQTALPRMDKASPVGEVMQTMLTYCLQDIMARQEIFLAAPDDPESIHQIRVKIRLLRSLLSFFKPLLNEEEYTKTAAGLRDLSGQLGRIRQLDVLRDEWQSLQQAYPDVVTGARSLEQRLKAERDTEKKAVYEQIAAGQATPQLLEIWTYFEQRPWMQHPDANLPLKQYTDQRLKKWARDIDKGFRAADYEDVRALHPLRIKTKKLRYVLQSLEPVLSRKYRTRMPQLKEWQDKLGTICDAHCDVDLTRQLCEGRKSSTLQFQSGVLTGFLLCRADAISESLRESRLS